MWEENDTNLGVEGKNGSWEELAESELEQNWLYEIFKELMKNK